MGILDNTVNNNNFVIPPAIRIAEEIKHHTKQTFNNVVNSYVQGTKMFWQNSSASPSEIAEALGTDAKEIFELHYKLNEFINTIKSETTTSANSIIGNFTMNEDGTVTVS